MVLNSARHPFKRLPINLEAHEPWTLELGEPGKFLRLLEALAMQVIQQVLAHTLKNTPPHNTPCPTYSELFELILGPRAMPSPATTPSFTDDPDHHCQSTMYVWFVNHLRYQQMANTTCVTSVGLAMVVRAVEFLMSGGRAARLVSMGDAIARLEPPMAAMSDDEIL